MMSNRIKNKLYNYEETPPLQVWDKVAASLTELDETFENKLFHFQQQPPQNTWDKIAEKLDDELPTKTKVVPLHRFPKLFKYAIAAAVILFMALGASYFTTTKTTAVSAIKPLAIHTPRKVTIPQQPVYNTSVTATTLAVSNTTQKTKKKNTFLHLASVKFASAVHLPLKSLQTNALAIVPKEKQLINTGDADRYMIALANNGNAVRLPKKVYPSFACADASDNMCKQKLASLQQQMASSLTTEFTGIIDLLQNLQDNH